MNYADDDWAVFWCSLLAPILLEEVQPGERSRFLQNLSQQEVTLPNGRRKRISLSTLRRKVRRFRQQKIAGLRRQPRSDRGRARKERQAMLERAVELKKQQPRRSPHMINEFLKREFGRTIPRIDDEPVSAQGRSHASQAGRYSGEDPLPLSRATRATHSGWATFRKDRVCSTPTA